MTMIPAYQNVQACKSRNSNVAGVVAFLGGENACLDVIVGQQLAFRAWYQFYRAQLIYFLEHTSTIARAGARDFLDNYRRDEWNEKSRAALIQEAPCWRA
jgi:hypothetical protein